MRAWSQSDGNRPNVPIFSLIEIKRPRLISGTICSIFAKIPSGPAAFCLGAEFKSFLISSFIFFVRKNVWRLTELLLCTVYASWRCAFSSVHFRTRLYSCRCTGAHALAPMRRRQIDFLYHNSVLCEFEPVYRWAFFPIKSYFLPPSISLRPCLQRERAALSSFPKDLLSTDTKNSDQSPSFQYSRFRKRAVLGSFGACS